ncbi:MAG TPA: hypothetical protein ENI76_02040, partial [Ignavibacteria bacterium]|nr:hypothetical protein [Ignavibacteria bacterium]
MLHKNALGAGQQPSLEVPHKFLRWALILFFVIEYIRPQGLANLKLQFVIILLMFFAFLYAKDRSWSKLLTAQLIFFLIVAKSLPLALNNYAVYSVMKVMFGYIAIVFAISWLMSWRIPFRQVILSWVLIIGYVSIYGMLHGGRGPGGMIGDENDLALAVVSVLPFALFGFDYLKGWGKWLSFICIVVFTAAIIASFSRGGFIGLAV